METDELRSEVLKVVKPIPFRGVPEFYDISNILFDPTLFEKVIQSMSKRVSKYSPTVVCALDARGFLFAAPIALRLCLPLVMIRKAGKLPGLCSRRTFDKEYETGDVFEMQCGRIQSSDRVVLIDDLLATGGSMKGAWDLVKESNPSYLVGLCLFDLGLPNSREFLLNNKMTIDSIISLS